MPWASAEDAASEFTSSLRHEKHFASIGVKFLDEVCGFSLVHAFKPRGGVKQNQTNYLYY